ncbi:MFS transporter [Rhizobium rhizogenes]|uniref:MFS transporter n=1 Tax=Rhizobium rhizogenes TaxID=359 RepID=UPI0015720AE7|nr:MFS transporter [Rhizobium rhizogenes]NTF98049.1 MFS transporter [Rhizobium rhizogenes]
MIESTSQDGFRWRVLLAIAVSSVCAGMVIMSFAPLIGDVAKDLNVDLGTASFSLIGITMFVSAIGIGLLGFWIDRIGIFRVIIAGQLLILLSNAAIPMIGSHLGPLVLIRILQGLGSAALTVAISPALALWFPREEMGRAMGLQSVGMALGIILGLNAGPLLSQMLGGWQLGVGLLSFVPLLALLITVPIAIASRSHSRAAAAEAHDQDTAHSSDFLRVPPFWVGLIALCLCYWVGLAFNGLSPGYLAVDPPTGAGYGSQGAGKLMLLFTLAGVAGPPLGGFLIDKLFEGRSSPLVAIGWVLGAVCYTAILFSPVHSNSVVLGAVLLGAGLANPFINVTLMSYAAKVFPPHIVGKVCGLWLSLSFLAGAGGVMACSITLSATGSYTSPILIIGIGSLIGLATVPFFKQPSPHERVAAL